MIPIQEQDLRKAVAGEYRGHLDRPIENVVIDSRKVTKNALFVAMKGENVDSHRFIAQAYDSGAGCVFASKEYASAHAIVVPEGRMLVVCEDPVLAMGDLAAWYRRQFRIPVVGVTGSVGKTSTKDMIAAALSGAADGIRHGSKYRSSGPGDGHEPFRRDSLSGAYREAGHRRDHEYRRLPYRVPRIAAGYSAGENGNARGDG